MSALKRNGTTGKRQKLLRAAVTGDPAAQFTMGKTLDLKGPTHAREAVNWYRLAAEHGHVEAANILGESYRDGNGVHRDGIQAVLWFRRAAANGSGAAQLSLGYELFSGQLVRRNIPEALKCYRRAARRGESSAKFNIAQMYERGEGLKKDLKRAVKWYGNAARASHVGAARRLAEIYSEQLHDKRKALAWLKVAASLGDARSLCALGVHFHEGDGVRKDLRRAAAAYRAAAHEEPWAQYLLGLCYRDGEGVPRRRSLARTWLAKAARRVPEARKALLAMDRARKARSRSRPTVTRNSRG